MAHRGMVAAVALACSLGAAAQSGDVSERLQRGDARGAYEAGLRTPERLGEPAFDRAFGIAAIHAGHAAAGVLALERVLLLDPRDEGARVELARGYFLLGDDARAREEFEAALASRPPAPVASAIREYLDALREREARHRATLVAHVDAGGGYDSNPRAGVDNPVISLPVLGEVTVPDAGVRAGDRTWQYGAGFRATMPVTGRTAFFAAGQADAVRYPTESDFDQALFAGSAGFLGQWRANSWRLGAARGYQTLDRKPYRHTHGVFLDWGMAVDARNVASLGVQGGRLAYAGANQVRDSDFAAVVLGWRHAFAAPWRPQLELAVNAGRERNVNGDRQDLSRDMLGARAAVAVTPWADWTVAAGALYQRSRYRDPDIVLDTTRDDRYAAGDLALTWTMLRGLTVRAELTEARNDSNLALHEYRRRTAILRGRYEFR